MEQTSWVVRSQEGGLFKVSSLYPRTHSTQTRKLHIIMGIVSSTTPQADIMAIYSLEAERDRVLNNFNRWLRENKKEGVIFTLPQDRETQNEEANKEE